MSQGVPAPPPKLGETRVESRGRIDYLDGVRALAALYVVVHHTWITVFPHGMADLHGLLKLGAVFNYGHIAVAAFIVVSGYSLTLGTIRHEGRLAHGIKGFFVRRFWRIVPPYWGALALSVVAGLTMLREPTQGPWGAAVPFDAVDVVVHIGLFQDFWHPYSINHVMWSIATEWHIYLLFPLMLLVARRARTAVLVGLTAVVFALGIAANLVGLGPMLGLVGCFCLGVAACRVAHGVDRSGGRAATDLPWLTVAVVATVAMAATLLAGMASTISNGLAGVALAALLVALAAGRATGVRRFLSTRTLTRIGVFSYSVYLIHPLVVQGAWLWVRTITGTPVEQIGLLALLAIPSAVFVSWLFFLVMERPFLRGRGLKFRQPVLGRS